MSEGAPLLRAEHLRKEFAIRGGLLRRIVGRRRAVDDVSLQLRAGETLGLVGESGCGKTTVGRLILRLVPASAGSVRYDGREVFELRARVLRALRRGMQMVFQDPGGSLNPMRRVGRTVAEPLIVHRVARGAEARRRAGALLERCGLAGMADRYPHELSGGQRQRVAIARALALEPKLLICDEPTSALDVSIQAAVLNLLMDLRAERGLAYLFISHDLAVVGHVCDRIAVMHQGRIVEEGERDRVLGEPRHDHTRALLAAVPGSRPR